MQANTLNVEVNEDGDGDKCYLAIDTAWIEIIFTTLLS